MICPEYKERKYILEEMFDLEKSLSMSRNKEKRDMSIDYKIVVLKQMINDKLTDLNKDTKECVERQNKAFKDREDNIITQEELNKVEKELDKKMYYLKGKLDAYKGIYEAIK